MRCSFLHPTHSVTKRFLHAAMSVDDDSQLNFIDLMLRARKEESEFAEVDNRSIVTSMLDFLVAGTDTTSMSAAALIRHLANDLQLQKKLIDEIDSVVGFVNTWSTLDLLSANSSCRDRDVTLADLDKLRLLDACVLEQMRLWPVASGTLIHVVTDDFELAGYHIEKGVRLSEVTHSSLF